MKFSVLLPTYNRLDLLKYAIESVRHQEYADWELIISDNQSEDDVYGYVQSLNDSRIHYSRTETLLNVTDNWNRTLSFATGDYFVMLGDDDALMPHYFTKMAQVIAQYHSPDWIYTEAYEYAYPEVLPEHPEGLLIAGRNPQNIWKTPLALNTSKRQDILQRSFDREVAINFNMQHSLIKRHFATTLPGNFFQSLFPDYYATLAGVIKAAQFVIYPQAMVVIGITRKSHGFYYFNKKMSEAKNILHTDDMNRQAMAKIEHLLLPAMDWIDVGWLSALQQLLVVYANELTAYNIDSTLQGFRRRVIRNSAKLRSQQQLLPEQIEALKSALPTVEYYRHHLFFYWMYCLGARELLIVAKRMMKKIRTTPDVGDITGGIVVPLLDVKNILDVIQHYPCDFRAITDLVRSY